MSKATNIATKKWRDANPEKSRAATKRWRSANSQKVNALSKKYRDMNPDKTRASRLKRLYGLGYSQYLKMLQEQNNLCGICRGNFTKKGPCVDHDHQTQEIRALLCSNCNCLLGNCQENFNILLLASRYLKKHLTNKNKNKNKSK